MKYILRNDLNSLKESFLKVFIFNFVPMIVYFLVLKITNEYVYSMVLNIAGLDISKNSSILEILLLVSNLVGYFYIIISIYTNDIKNNKCNIFLRIKKKEWVYKKLLSLSLCILIYTLIRIIFFNILSYILVGNLLINILFNTSIYYILFSVILVILFSYNKILSFVFLVLSIIFPFNIYNFNYYYILILLIITILLFILFINRKDSFLEIFDI